MRLSFPLAALLAACLAAVEAPPVAAQVSVDLHALDKLPQSAPPSAAAAPAAAASSRHRGGRTAARADKHHGRSHGRAEAHGDSHPGPTADHGGKTATAPAPAPAPTAAARPAAPPAATLPTAAPPPVVLSPGPPPTVATEPPPKPPIAADAGGDAMPMADGLRITFLPSRFDLSPDTSDALHHFAAVLPRSDSVTLDVRAYAAAVPDDPSAARRLSLSRSLAIRAALMNEGIPSTRIFLRALGANAGTGPADRCDVLISRLGAEPAAPGGETGAAARPDAGTAVAAAPRAPADAGARPIARP
jgi:outer membrane protein OmpA-like peptidoglycan-associated protein